jgi:hypothetical protein
VELMGNKLCEEELDGTGSASCPMMNFGIGNNGLQI